MLTCSACRQSAPPTSKFQKKLLLGDTFYRYTCPTCHKEGEIFDRVAMSWINIIQLVLFHLHKTDRTGVGFFRWKEDICRLIEDRWDDLCPSKNSNTLCARLYQALSLETASWMNSVSSVLSANPSIFESGFEKLKQPGWWALKTVSAPKPTAIQVQSKSASSTDATTKRSLIAKKLRAEEDPVESDVVDVGEDDYRYRSSQQIAEPQTKPNIAPTTYPFRYDFIPSVTSLLPSLDPAAATPSTMRAAEEIKRKLVERLLRVDSKLLKEALSNAPPTPSLANRPASTPPFLSDRDSLISFSERFIREECARMIKSSASSPGPPAVSSATITVKEKIKVTKVPKPANYVRASPHENELLEMCLRVSSPHPQINRLRRKLIIRRLKRRAGLRVFEIDTIMYKYLKSSDSLRPLATIPGREGAASPQALIPGQPLDRQTFFDVPFQEDPSLSFRAKLLGISNVLRPYPPEMISPFTGLRLPGILHREERIVPLKLRLLRDLVKARPPYDPDTEEESVAVDAIDFVHIRKEWLPQVNRLLRDFFWPSVDMCESLDHPDYSIVAMYRKLVVGCAFMTPDGYITYLFVHPEWANAGLGTKLLHILVSKIAPPYQDITLHVSASNPALILYQKFGFKPEQFVVNFFDKYFAQSEGGSGKGSSHLHSKNAFLIRLRR